MFAAGAAAPTLPRASPLAPRAFYTLSFSAALSTRAVISTVGITFS